MVYRVYQRAIASCLDSVIVATDDTRIADTCHRLGCNVRLTSGSHRTGTDRLSEIARAESADIWVNIQGDEPLIPPRLIDAVVATLTDDPFLDIVTASHAIRDVNKIRDPNSVKVVLSRTGDALYFSRAPIPHCFTRSRKPGLNQIVEYRKHIGIYGYRRSALLKLADLEPHELELLESLEQLRALEYGMRIHVLDSEYEGLEINTKHDLELLLARLGGEDHPWQD